MEVPGEAHAVVVGVGPVDELEAVARELLLDPGVHRVDAVGAYPGAEDEEPPPHNDVVVPLRLRDGLSFFSTVATFGTAVDITVSELSIEAFFPADKHTAAALRDC